MSPSIIISRSSYICIAVSIMTCSVGTVSSLPSPLHQQPQQQQREDGPVASGSTVGFGTVVWSVLTGCFDSDSTEPAAVCFKSKALTALDRTLAKSAVDIADGVSLANRVDRPLTDLPSEKADRAALDATKNPDQKLALLDSMIADRMDTLISTKSIVLGGSIGQEGEFQVVRG